MLSAAGEVFDGPAVTVAVQGPDVFGPQRGDVHCRLPGLLHPAQPGEGLRYAGGQIGQHGAFVRGDLAEQFQGPLGGAAVEFQGRELHVDLPQPLPQVCNFIRQIPQPADQPFRSAVAGAIQSVVLFLQLLQLGARSLQPLPQGAPLGLREALGRDAVRPQRFQAPFGVGAKLKPIGERGIAQSRLQPPVGLPKLLLNAAVFPQLVAVLVPAAHLHGGQPVPQGGSGALAFLAVQRPLPLQLRHPRLLCPSRLGFLAMVRLQPLQLGLQLGERGREPGQGLAFVDGLGAAVEVGSAQQVAPVVL